MSIPKPPLAKTAHIDVRWTAAQPGISAHNILYVYAPGASDQIAPSDLALIATAVVGTSAPTGLRRLLPSIGTNWTLAQVTVADNGGSTAVSTTLPALAGTGGVTGLPPNVAVCLSWSINARYRGGKPRTYLAGPPNTATTTQGYGDITTTYASALRNAAQSMLNDINAASVGASLLTLGTISYSHNKAPRPVPLFVPFIGVHVHQRMDSQRRRLGKESSFAII